MLLLLLLLSLSLVVPSVPSLDRTLLGWLDAISFARCALFVRVRSEQFANVCVQVAELVG